MSSPSQKRRPDNRPIGARPTGRATGPATQNARPTERVARGPVGPRKPPPPTRDDRRLMLIVGGIVAAVAVIIGGFVLLNSGKGGGSPVPTIAAGAPVGASAAAGSSAAAVDLSKCPTAAPAPLAATDTATVTLQTAKGNIVIAIKGSLAPNATGNFVALAQCGYYDGVVFHRLVPGFVIQGGDGQYGRSSNLDSTQVGRGGPGYTITDDPVTATYHRGTVAMARSSAPNSQGSQFFIVLNDGAAQALAQVNTYAIMGEVTSGLDAVDAIGAMPNAGEAKGNAAINPLPIIKATVTRP
jgi:peptidyl-prolyl cis-trans isomerase B (cyclophilin B)